MVRSKGDSKIIITVDHLVTKRTRRLCENNYYIYTKELKSVVMVRP